MDASKNYDQWSKENGYPNGSMPENGNYAQQNYAYNNYSHLSVVSTNLEAPDVTNEYSQNFDDLFYPPSFTTFEINESIHNPIQATTPSNFIQGYGNPPNFNDNYNYQMNQRNEYNQQFHDTAHPNNALYNDLNNRIQDISLQDDTYSPSNLNSFQQPFDDIFVPPVFCSPQLATSVESQHLPLQYPSENVMIPSLPSLGTFSLNNTSESSEDSESSSNNKPSIKKRGRPKVHKTTEARMAAKNEAQKRYAGKRKATLIDLQNEIPFLQMQNLELKAKKAALMKTCKQMLFYSNLEDFDRNLIRGELNIVEKNI